MRRRSGQSSVRFNEAPAERGGRLAELRDWAHKEMSFNEAPAERGGRLAAEAMSLTTEELLQ